MKYRGQKEKHFHAGMEKKVDVIEGISETDPHCEKENGRKKEKTNSQFYQFLRKTNYDPELMFQGIFQQNNTSYFYFGDLQKDLFYISDNMREAFGFQRNIISGLLTEWEKRIVSEEEKEKYRDNVENMVKHRRCIHDLRYRVRNIEGKIIWIRCYGVLTWNEDKTVPLFFSGRVTHQDDDFIVDPVTGFPRTVVMLQRMNEINEDTIRTIGFSLNNITEINNTKGRAYADHLVRMIADDLVKEFSSKTFFYRLDGMRYLAIMDPSYTEKKDHVVEAIRDIVSKRYKMMGISIQTSCSFAFMEYCRLKTTPADFLEQMVSLIKVAKHNCNSAFEEYSDDNIYKIKYMSKMALTLSHDVLNGMDNFEIVIQPMVSGKNGEIVGGEALMRWYFDGAVISPLVFIPMLEKAGMIHIAGRWVFEQAVCACIRCRCYRENFSMTFNVSMHQLADTGFTEYMRQILYKYELDGRYLIAEMTENFMDVEPDKMFEFVDQCKQMGISIALDDFGNGYSSFRRLLQYPSSLIKLDRTLMGEMMESEEKKNFISSIVYACHKFGKKVCMEGVENAEQNSMIKEADCDMIQGYYYYKPIKTEEMYQLLISVSDRKK